MSQMGHFLPIQRGFAIPVIHRRRHRTRWVAAPLRVVAAEAAFLLSASSRQGVFCWSHACRSVVRYSFACPAAQRLRRFAAANHSTRPLPLSCFKLKSGVHDFLQAPSQHSGGWS